MKAIEKVEAEIAQGKLGIARDRLHGLVNSYPNELQFRSRLGDVYFMLGYPCEAGRFWFLDENLTAEKRDSIQKFIQLCQEDPKVIVRRLKLRCDLKLLKGVDANEYAMRLIAACENQNIEVSRPKSSDTRVSASWGFPHSIGCLLTLVLIVTLVIVGLITVAGWLIALRGR